MRGEIDIPVLTRAFSISCKVIFQRTASFGSLFVTVYSTVKVIGKIEKC